MIHSSLAVFPTPDIQRTAAFYEQKLGFRRMDYLNVAQPHSCLYRDRIEIILVQADEGRAVMPNTELYGRGEDAYLIADDQQALQDEFLAAGVEIEEPLHMTDYHNLEFTARDIDGRRLVFGQKQWQAADDAIWAELYSRAHALVNDRALSGLIQAGGVAAALVTGRGSIYTGVCIDTASSLGMCAERNALANMITNGESDVRKLVAVMSDGSVGSPCGACREFMMQLSASAKDIEILTDRQSLRTVRLGELMPDWWGERLI